MRNDNGIYHNFRLSRNNPRDVRINEVLRDINKELYKSKNQFIADALEFYISALEGSGLTNEEALKKIENEKYITKEDLEIMELRIREELIKYLDNEVLQHFMKFAAEMVGMKTSGIGTNYVSDDIDESGSDEEDEELAGIASQWA